MQKNCMARRGQNYVNFDQNKSRISHDGSLPVSLIKNGGVNFYLLYYGSGILFVGEAGSMSFG